MHKKTDSKTHRSKWFNRLIIAISSILFAGGIYLLILVMTPNLPVIGSPEKIDVKALSKPEGDRIYIPKIGVNVALIAGGTEALEKGAWHRFPERGDPVEGGNFIVSAHRFSLGITPGSTRTKSPFYHIDKLVNGDQIIVDFKGKRYGYQITNHKQVKPEEVSIEAPLKEDEQPRMTLYTCTFKGEADGREVYFAKPLGEVVDGMVEI